MRNKNDYKRYFNKIILEQSQSEIAIAVQRAQQGSKRTQQGSKDPYKRTLGRSNSNADPDAAQSVEAAADLTISFTNFIDTRRPPPGTVMAPSVMVAPKTLSWPLLAALLLPDVLDVWSESKADTQRQNDMEVLQKSMKLEKQGVRPIPTEQGQLLQSERYPGEKLDQLKQRLSQGPDLQPIKTNTLAAEKFLAAHAGKLIDRGVENVSDHVNALTTHTQRDDRSPTSTINPTRTMPYDVPLTSKDKKHADLLKLIRGEKPDTYTEYLKTQKRNFDEDNAQKQKTLP